MMHPKSQTPRAGQKEGEALQDRGRTSRATNIPAAGERWLCPVDLGYGWYGPGGHLSQAGQEEQVLEEAMEAPII